MYRDVVMVFSSFRNRRRLFHSHPRLMIALVTGLPCGVALPEQWGISAQALTGWNTAVSIYLALMGWQILRGDVHRIRRVAEQEDANAILTLAVVHLRCVDHWHVDQYCRWCPWRKLMLTDRLRASVNRGDP